MKKTIIFSLMALCLLVLPVSAWEQTFEGHPNDLEPNEYLTYSVEEDFEIIEQDGGNVLEVICPMNELKILTIDNGWNGYLAFSFSQMVYGSYGSSTPRIGIVMYNSSDQVIFTDTSMVVPGAYTSKTVHQAYRRIEFIETESGEGINAYVDNVLKDSTAYTIEGEEVAYIKIYLMSTYGGGYFYLDDFTTSSKKTVVDCGPEVTSEDSAQYFRFGYPKTVSDYTWFYRIYDSDLNTIVSDTNITDFEVQNVPLSTLPGEGEYSIKLFYVYSGQSYFSTSRNFDYVLPSDYSITIENSEVSPGETLDVYCYNAAGFSLQCDGPGSDDLESYTINSDEQIIHYSIPSNSVSGTGVVILKNPSGVKVDYGFFEVVGGVGGDSSINFDKSAYTNTEKVTITYSDLPAGCQIQLTGTKSGSSTKVISETYSKTGSGIFYYQLSGEDISSLYVVAAYDGELLDSDSATVASGDDYVIYGTVYDANTLTAIEGASVAVGGIVVYTDDSGRYDMSVSAGTKNLVVGADGYNSLSTTIDVVSVSTLKNIYLVPVSTEGNIIYGACADYDTGEAIGTAYIQISNGSVTYSTLGRTSTGAYTFEGLPNGSTWTLSASKTGYDNYQKIITVDGSTFHLIKLVSQTSSTSEDEEDSTEASTERPGREAAQEAMEEFEALAPGLIGLVVVKVIKELMK